MGRTVNNNQQAFFELLRAGLWEKEARLFPFDGVDYVRVNRLAQEQSVVGLVAAGLEHVQDVKVPRDVALSFAGATLQFEHRNQAMNEFVAGLIERLTETVDMVPGGVVLNIEAGQWHSLRWF